MCKNNEKNDTFYRKVAFLMYTEMVNFNPQNWKAASKLKLGTTIIHKNNETNDKFYRKVAFLTYTESVKFRSQSRETASKRKPYRGLGTR